MNRKSKDKLILTLLVIILAAFLVSIVLGALVDIKYFIISSGIAIFVWSKMLLNDQRKRKSDNLLFQNTLANCPGGKPHFHCGLSYGRSTYTITFASEALMELAIKNGNIENFKNALADLHRGTGFRPSRAVHVTAIGRITDSESTLANGEKAKWKFRVDGVERDGSPTISIIHPEPEQHV